MNRLVAALAFAGLSACATTASSEKPAAAQKPAQVRVQRPAYSIPLPTGWEEVSSQAAVNMVGQDGVVVKNPTLQPLPEFSTARIFVKAISNLNVDPHSAADCEKIAPDIGKAMQSKVDAAKLVSLPASGDTCSIELSSEQATNVRARSTIVSPAAGSAWMVTCNYDARDPSAASDCESVLKGFQASGGASGSSSGGSTASAPTP